jgi:hypothetical protein
MEYTITSEKGRNLVDSVVVLDSTEAASAAKALFVKYPGHKIFVSWCSENHSGFLSPGGNHVANEVNWALYLR